MHHRPGEKAKLFRCMRCGHETTENATRFAQHILKCERATDEDRSIASGHEAFTEKRRQTRKAKQRQEVERQQAGTASPVPWTKREQEQQQQQQEKEKQQVPQQVLLPDKDISLEAEAAGPDTGLSLSGENLA